MARHTLFTLSVEGIRQRFITDLPSLHYLAVRSRWFDSFLDGLLKYISDVQSANPTPAMSEAADHLKTLVEFEGRDIYELSKDKEMKIETLELLWTFLRDGQPDQLPTDLYIDLYVLFMQIEGRYLPTADSQVETQMRRWPSGLKPEIMEARRRSKHRIMLLLVTKIGLITSPHSRYHFADEMTHEERYNQVGLWWNDYRFHLAMAVKSPRELNVFLNKTLSAETMATLNRAKQKGIPFMITPYYLSLLNIDAEGFDDSTIRSYVLYSERLVDSYGSIRAWEREDKVESGQPNAAGWLLPDGHNIHRRYPEVAIMIPDTMGRACGGLCAVCQRMYDFQSERLNFNFEALAPKESWDKKLSRLMHYFEEDTQLRDILITGGDALMSSNNSLAKVLDAVYRMAKRKRQANAFRPDGEKYAEIQRVRLGSRLLAYLPMRIDEKLIEILKEFRAKAMSVGIRQFVIQTHFESPLEVTADARRAIRALTSAGWTITNQLVYTVAASRRGHSAKLRKILNQQGVLCYYTFSVKGFNENYELFTPNSRSLQESREEKSLGLLSDEQMFELTQQIDASKDKRVTINAFLEKYRLPFVATDRNVLNLPGIGKSMTFKTVGITLTGKRILKFEHDTTRRHSPVLNQMGDIFIVENKSLTAYLMQLKQMGETIKEYDSIWSYRAGETEPRFGVYEYPEFDFQQTKEITHIQPLSDDSVGQFTFFG